MHGTRFVRLSNCAVADLAGKSIAANFKMDERWADNAKETD